MTARVVDIPLAGMRHLSGWKPDRPDHRDVMLAVAPTLSLPDDVDLRPHCPPVRDQGQLGSCVANATLEAEGYLYTREGKNDPMMSRLDLYLKARDIGGTPAAEDSGCQIRDAFKAAATLGVCFEKTWPYDIRKFAERPPASSIEEAAQHKILFYYRCPSHHSVMAGLAQGYPVVFGFPVPENMESASCARTGIVQFPTPTEGFVGGHAVLAVGYSRKRGVYICQNSWGRGWADMGFFYLPFRFFQDGMATDCWTLRREMQPELVA